METNITALTELISRLDKLINNFPDDAGLKTSKEIAIELLDKEKEQIKRGYKEAFLNKDQGIKCDPEDYYLKTYKSTLQTN